MYSRLVLLPLVVLFLGVSIQPASSQSAGQTPSNSLQQSSALLKEWSVAWKTRDADAIAALYSSDAVIYPADHARINPRDEIGDFHGPDAIRDYFKQVFEGLATDGGADFIIPLQSEESQNLSVDDTFLQFRIKGECGRCIVKGFSLMVLHQHGSDGKWLIVRQSFDSNLLPNRE